MATSQDHGRVDATMTERTHHRIHTVFTRSRFLHVEDALEIGKIRLFAGQYQAGQGMNGTPSTTWTWTTPASCSSIC